MPGEARRRLTVGYGFLCSIGDGGRTRAMNHLVPLGLTRSAVQAGRRPHEVTTRAFQSDTVDTARLVMGEFPQRLGSSAWGCDSRDERARARLCVSGCQRSVSCRTFEDRRDPLERRPPLRIERTNLADRQGRGRIRTRRPRDSDWFACRGYLTIKVLIRSRQEEDR